MMTSYIVSKHSFFCSTIFSFSFRPVEAAVGEYGNTNARATSDLSVTDERSCANQPVRLIRRREKDERYKTHDITK
jgi:hypothetical protein